MLTPDQINGSFELAGAYFTWSNFAAYYKARELVGVYWPATAFFTLWGLWNLYYYPAIGQPLSFSGGIALTSGSLAWLVLVLWDKFTNKLDAEINEWPL